MWLNTSSNILYKNKGIVVLPMAQASWMMDGDRFQPKRRPIWRKLVQGMLHSQLHRTQRRRC